MAKFNPHEDAERLRAIAAHMTYNGSIAEARAKHALYEIAMRLETGGYVEPKEAPKETPFTPWPWEKL